MIHLEKFPTGNGHKLRATLPVMALFLAFCICGMASDVYLECGRSPLGGEEYQVSWSTLPHSTEEFEILLVVVSPVPFKFRLTESEDPTLDGLRVRLPNLGCDVAHLVLRMGSRGEESVWAESAPFEIVHSPGAPSRRVVLYRGEYWLREDRTAGEMEAGDRRFGNLPDGGGAPIESQNSQDGLQRMCAAHLRSHIDNLSPVKPSLASPFPARQVPLQLRV